MYPDEAKPFEQINDSYLWLDFRCDKEKIVNKNKALSLLRNEGSAG